VSDDRFKRQKKTATLLGRQKFTAETALKGNARFLDGNNTAIILRSGVALKQLDTNQSASSSSHLAASSFQICRAMRFRPHIVTALWGCSIEAQLQPSIRPACGSLASPRSRTAYTERREARGCRQTPPPYEQAPSLWSSSDNSAGAPDSACQIVTRLLRRRCPLPDITKVPPNTYSRSAYSGGMGRLCRSLGCGRRGARGPLQWQRLPRVRSLQQRVPCNCSTVVVSNCDRTSERDRTRELVRKCWKMGAF